MVVISTHFSAPVEGVLFQTPSTKLLINNQELGTATLYITESNVVWGGGVSSAGGPSPTINLLYPSISLHAIQRDPMPALYMVLNYDLRLPEMVQEGDSQAQEDDDDFDVDDQPITQLRFVPQQESELQPLFSAMNQGQSLNPDPTDEVDEDSYLDGEEFEEVDEEFEDAEEAAASPEDAAGRLRLLRLDHSNGGHALQNSHGQYEDAEDDEIEEV